ncbi:hypothetical protein [Lacticaseibacillus jixiensis]|uniref:hypothetical protein n=1 Tax=Lacticaseibacillus jixiensis TaxID=3231926 RepID=UPI0036F3B7CD
MRDVETAALELAAFLGCWLPHAASISPRLNIIVVRQSFIALPLVYCGLTEIKEFLVISKSTEKMCS